MVTRNVQNWTGVEGEKGPQHIPTTFVVLLCYPVLCNLIDGTHREEVMGALFSRERRHIFLSSEIIEALWLQLSTLHKYLCSFVSHPLHCCWHPLLCSLEYLNKSCVAVPLRDSTLQQSKQFTVSSASWRGYKKLFCLFLSSPGDSAWTKTYNLIIIKLFFFFFQTNICLPAWVVKSCLNITIWHFIFYFILHAILFQLLVLEQNAIHPISVPCVGWGQRAAEKLRSPSPQWPPVASLGGRQTSSEC